MSSTTDTQSNRKSSQPSLAGILWGQLSMVPVPAADNLTFMDTLRSSRISRHHQAMQ